MRKKTWIGIVGGMAALGVLYGFQKPASDATQIKQLTSLIDVKMLGVATTVYASDWDNVYPFVTNVKSLKVVTFPYVKDKKYWRTENPKGEIHFNFSLGGARVKDIADPGKVPMYYESQPWSDRSRAVSFVDGSGRMVSSLDWGETASRLLLHLPKAGKPLPVSTGNAWKD